jgi:hypothetical protein
MTYTQGQLIVIRTRLLLRGAIDAGGESETIYMFLSSEDGIAKVYKLSTGDTTLIDLSDPRIMSHQPYNG